MPHLVFRQVRIALVATLAGLAGLSAQDQPAAPGADAVQQRLNALEAQLSALKAQVQQANDATATLGRTVDKLHGETDVDNGFAWGGYLDVNLSGQGTQNAQTPGRTVGVAFNPILTYSWREDWLAVAELNISPDGLELGQAFIANTMLPHVILLAGLAPMPFAAYSERYSPAWINKCGELPPLAYNESCGLFASDISDYEVAGRGDIDLGGNRRLNWHAFVSQGPTYAANDGSDDRLTFGGNTGPTSRTPTVGGRLGYLPQPGIEVGVSAMGGSVANNNIAFTPDDHRRFLAYALDAEYHVGGAVLRGEWVGLRYDTSDARRINSQAAYLQASHLLKELDGAWAKLEPVVRVGKLTRSDAVTTAEDYQKVYEYGVGANYYFTSYIRSSLMLDGFNGEAHALDRIVLNTTFAF